MLLFASSFFVKRRSLQLSHSHFSFSVFLEVMFMFLFAFYLVHQKCASPRCVSMNQRLRGIIAAHVHGGGTSQTENVFSCLRSWPFFYPSMEMTEIKVKPAI